MKLIQMTSMLFTMVMLLSCAQTQKSNVVASNSPIKIEVAKVRLLYGTNRALLLSQGIHAYGTGYGQLTYGYCDVEVQIDNRLSHSFMSTMKDIFPNEEDNKKYRVQIEPLHQDHFYTTLRSRLQEAKSNSVLLYVHGYANSFYDAAKTAAQIAYDIDFKGIPMFYSWPSLSSPTLTNYGMDRERIMVSEARLLTFLEDTIEHNPDSSIYIIAHSMGTRAVVGALKTLNDVDPSKLNVIKEVILAAPDIKTDGFENEIAPSLVDMGRKITVYASNDDYALRAAKLINDGFKRLGDSGNGIPIIAGVESIDASSKNTSLIGHSYIGEPSVLTDIYYLIHYNLRPDSRRTLSKKQFSKGSYWYFRDSF